VNGRPLVVMTQREDADPRRGETRDSLDGAWAEFMAACGLDMVPIPTRTADVAAYLDRLGADGVVLTGGGGFSCLEPQAASPRREALEARLIATALGRGLPILGVCRGMQALCLHFGGRLHRVGGHTAVAHPVISRSPRIGHTRVNSYHDWGMTAHDLPRELIPLAEAGDGTVEAVAGRTGNCLGIMWHPERTAPFDAHDLRLFREFFAASGEGS